MTAVILKQEVDSQVLCPDRFFSFCVGVEKKSGLGTRLGTQLQSETAISVAAVLLGVNRIQ